MLSSSLNYFSDFCYLDIEYCLFYFALYISFYQVKKLWPKVLPRWAQLRREVNSAIYKLCSHCNKELTIKKYREHKNFFFQEETQTWIKELDESDDGSGTSEMTSLDDFEVDTIQLEALSHFQNAIAQLVRGLVLRILVLKILLTVTMKMNQLMPKVVYD